MPVFSILIVGRFLCVEELSTCRRRRIIVLSIPNIVKHRFHVWWWWCDLNESWASGQQRAAVGWRWCWHRARVAQSQADLNPDLHRPIVPPVAAPGPRSAATALMPRGKVSSWSAAQLTSSRIPRLGRDRNERQLSIVKAKLQTDKCMYLGR